LLGMSQVVERGHDETLRQVTSGTENHHRAGRRGRGALILLSFLGFDGLIVLAQMSFPIFALPSYRLRFSRNPRGFAPAGSVATE
jgi:hypothetical protein